MSAYGLHGIVSKKITITNILTTKVNIGVPFIGTPQHIIALQLKEINPFIEIIPMGSDPKALPSLMDNSLDMYIVSDIVNSQWARDFNFTSILHIPANEKVNISGHTIINVGITALYAG
jgi:hypothetical protein